MLAWWDDPFSHRAPTVTQRTVGDGVVKLAPLRIDTPSSHGLYDKQTNEAEARRVAAILSQIWREPRARPTIGIVTFNRKQADLIEEILEEIAEGDQAFRQALAQERERVDHGEDMGFFVKNVENVQGDERDIILFSTTFGRNSAGTFRRFFGELGVEPQQVVPGQAESADGRL